MSIKFILLALTGLFTFSANPAKAEEAQINCIAENVYYEARGEPDKGKIAVANVVMNRVNDKRFPNTPCSVVKQRSKGSCQFSWVCSKHKSIKNKSLYEEAKRIASDVYYKRQRDITNGSKFFHSLSVRPNWKLFRTMTIGRHVFYR